MLGWCETSSYVSGVAGHPDYLHGSHPFVTAGTDHLLHQQSVPSDRTEGLWGLRSQASVRRSLAGTPKKVTGKEGPGL